MGSNMAENHPIAFRFVMEAKERGATIIHVDPRFTRTSALADIYAPLRAGSDIAFLGGLISYILEQRAAGSRSTSSTTPTSRPSSRTSSRTPSELDGLFSGWDAGQAHVRRSTPGSTAGMDVPSTLAEHYATTSTEVRAATQKLQRLTTARRRRPDAAAPALRLPDPASATTPPTRRRWSSASRGCPRETFLKVAEAICRQLGPRADDRLVLRRRLDASHHRRADDPRRAIIQTLLGNIGRPGGGILALRGHASIQGSTDIPTLYNLLPGYLPQPSAQQAAQDARGVPRDARRRRPAGGTTSRSTSSACCAPGTATRRPADNELGLRVAAQDHRRPFAAADDAGDARRHDQGTAPDRPEPGRSAATTPHMIRKALPNLDWMVVREIFENETASFWYDSPEVRAGELRPQDIKTEIFLLPAALPGEKEGTFTNTQRLIQWHDKVVEPPGDMPLRPWFFYHLGQAAEGAVCRQHSDPQRRADPEPDLGLSDDQGRDSEPSAEAVLKEINGYTWPDGQQIAGLQRPQGRRLDRVRLLDLHRRLSRRTTTTRRARARPMRRMARARTSAGASPGRATGASCTTAPPPTRRASPGPSASATSGGTPSKASGPATTSRTSPRQAAGLRARLVQGTRTAWTPIDGRSPFIMIADGKAWLFVPSGLKDGPLPTHYEPVESPVATRCTAQQDNPVAKKWERPDNPYHAVGDPRYPVRHDDLPADGAPLAAASDRWMSWRRPSCSRRGSPRFRRSWRASWASQNLRLGGGVHRARRNRDAGAGDGAAAAASRSTAGASTRSACHGTSAGRAIATGDIANDLTAIVGDPNTTIHEGKAFTCNLRKGRLSRSAAASGHRSELSATGCPTATSAPRSRARPPHRAAAWLIPTSPN